MAKPGASRFAKLVANYLAGQDHRELAPRVRVHYTTLYAWANGREIPGEPMKIRSLARELGLSEEQEAELQEEAALARTAAAADRHIGDLADIAETSPEALDYEPDLEEVDISQWKGAGDLSPETVAKANRAIRAFLSEVRRRG